jgi:hypothetical protein
MKLLFHPRQRLIGCGIGIPGRVESVDVAHVTMA